MVFFSLLDKMYPIRYAKAMIEIHQTEDLYKRYET